MKSKLISLFIMLLFITGCSGAKEEMKFDVNNILNEEEMELALKDPQNNKGASLEFVGQVYNFIQKDTEYHYYQINRDVENYDKSIALRISNDLAENISEDQFVIGNGIILGELEGTNLLGGDISTPVIDVNELTVGKFEDTVAKAKHTSQINLTEEQNDVFVTIEKLEISDFDTRLHVKIDNKSEDKVSFYSFDFKMIINGKNYSEEYSFLGEYKEIESELYPGTSTTGIITYESLDADEIQEVKIVVDRPYSDNWEIDFHDYIFDVKLK